MISRIHPIPTTAGGSLRRQCGVLHREVLPMERRRWIITFTPFLLCVFLGRGNIVHAEVWSKTYSVGGVPEITISARHAKVHVHASTTGAIDVRVDSGQRPLGKDGISVEDLQTGNVVNV